MEVLSRNPCYHEPGGCSCICSTSLALEAPGSMNQPEFVVPLCPVSMNQSDVSLNGLCSGSLKGRLIVTTFAFSLVSRKTVQAKLDCVATSTLHSIWRIGMGLKRRGGQGVV